MEIQLPPKESLTIEQYNQLLQYVIEAGQMFQQVKQIKIK